MVLGILNPDGSVDAARMGVLVELARPMNVTFHRAFDMSRDPHQAMEDLVKLGMDRIVKNATEVHP